MKLFAPRNVNWDYKSGESGWSFLGHRSSAGVNVTHGAAESLSAVSCGIRVYAEAIAQLPCALMEQEDYRTTRFATDHPLWRLLHDEPNPEQTHFQFFNFMTCMAVGWGNAYAEIQQNSQGEKIGLWPIHPSRIPKRNIKRNGIAPETWGEIVVGAPGEIVYYVNNNDGTQYAIPAADMLHVPGMMSEDGITGRGIVEIGASSIGIALATEEHAGAFFRNGAAPNIAIKSPKIVGKETADRLRQQWQTTFGGVKNHYKTILLEDGMEPVPFSISPEASQLLTSRQFSVDELSRILKLPPHKLNSMGRATWANIEQQAQEFVDYSLMPYVKQWEETLSKKLLTDEEKKTYRFKINVMALLRGDSAARSAFYRSLFDMGALSPNDIRELEDWNPVDDGDQYFVPANNLVPLSKIGEMAQANVDKAQADTAKTEQETKQLKEPPPKPVSPPSVEPDDVDEAMDIASAAAVRQAKADEAMQATKDALRLGIQATIEGFMHRESRAVRQAAKKPETFLTWRDEFYPEFEGKLNAAVAAYAPAAERIGSELCRVAQSYVADSLSTLEPLTELSCKEFETGVASLVDSWGDRPARYAAVALKEKETPCAI